MVAESELLMRKLHTRYTTNKPYRPIHVSSQLPRNATSAYRTNAIGHMLIQYHDSRIVPRCIANAHKARDPRSRRRRDDPDPWNFLC